MIEKDYYKNYYHENKEKFVEYRLKRDERNHVVTATEWTQCKKYFENKCAYCGMTEEKSIQEYQQTLHKEHAINDGADDITNCIPACKGCNSKKWTHDINDWYVAENPVYSIEKLNKITLWMETESKNL